ncbi:uncharacterized protein E0L32_004815 [Thyridium curvatum]|uniref:Ribosomal RNA-processing protein 8 n=1 Tax=Thyridium curvatum TaxID=1093900 RepID=A0A507AW25_9PEZI|nr:uncharacterized protein E0L32_004815 [Thyridium curvatum]TPX14985.1 hypothetical protein E0L32_004815 [Thyridium curvatum]
MFAVKGWSVSADKLKPEAAAPAPSDNAAGAAAPSKSRKRKRPGQGVNVTADNVADLWESVIEHKGEKKKKKPAPQKAAAAQDHKAPEPESRRPEKKQKKSKSPKDGQHKTEHPGGSDAKSPAADSAPSSKEKSKKKAKKGNAQAADESHSQPKAPQGSDQKSHDTSKAISKATPSAAPPAPKLTPLQASMREKLISARFRHLNETLYTRPSAEAYRLFQDAPEMFQEYHEGFRRQVDVWPENPVDSYIREILARGRQKFPPRGGRGAPSGPGAVVSLPRTNGTCTVADLGCGDARLGSTLDKARRKLHLEILSFDLQSPAEHVTRADIANLPLADGAVDVAIFCLALMGTNWLDFVEEAYRILRWKGELWVAEIKSRFGHVGRQGGKGKVVDHSVGNRKKAGAGKKGGKKDPNEPTEADEADLAVEVDGADDRRQATDVSAFVEALRKRGFLLAGEANEAIDMSNKMFVKMRFVKAAPPIKGKGVAKLKDAGERGPKIKKKFIEAADKEDTVDETSILKPCVYKIR